MRSFADAGSDDGAPGVTARIATSSPNCSHDRAGHAPRARPHQRTGTRVGGPWLAARRRLHIPFHKRQTPPAGLNASAQRPVRVRVRGFYAPHPFSSYPSRYAVVGADLAMISTLFGLMLALVASAVLGREVFEMLDRIRRGERPRDDEVGATETPWSTRSACRADGAATGRPRTSQDSPPNSPGQ